jgi:bifunctional non-homologous end joining protein LigD
VHVEDHPYDYRSFEGMIPKGEYGGGAVIIWDEGSWVPEGDPAAGMKKGHLSFELKGSKLNGAWHLVRLKPRSGEKRDNWLLIKSNDDFARPGEDILAEAPASVKSGRTIEDVEAGRKAKAPAKAKAPRGAKKATGKRAPAASRKAPAKFVPIALATLKSTPPSGEEWLHEVKFDGYRIEAQVIDGKVTLFTRSGLDWSGKFGDAIVEALASLDCDEAVIDGEVVVLTDDGLSSFSALQEALSKRRTERMFYYMFDLLRLDGEDLRKEALVERKAQLFDLAGEAAAEKNSPLRYSEHFSEPGATMLSHACRMGLEGVVSKRADAPYPGGRTLAWIKSKCTERQEFVIVGYLPSEKRGRGVRSLVVAYHEKGKLTYAGHVGTGFSATNAADLKQRLDALRRDKPAFAGPGSREKRAVWVEPELVAEVEFRAWTSDGILRHASYQGLREDKPADEVVAETPEPENNARAGKAAKPAGKKPATRKKATTSVTLSNADKKLWPEAGVSKQDMLDHYASVWPRMEQFVVNRPLALVRAPDGIHGQRFFQKHASKGMNEAVRRFADPEDGEELLYIDSFDGLAALVQLGVVEIHIWGSKIDAIETPDQIVFDLDPDEGLDVEAVRAATLDVQGRLDELGMATFLKTTGGKGFHVVVPLKPRADWVAVKTFSHDFAHAMEQASPDLYTATLSKKARKGRIFIDYLRNGRGSTAVAPWSTRAKEKATVSVPITFDMLAKGVGPGDYTVGGLKDALKKHDPWADFFKQGKALSR